MEIVRRVHSMREICRQARDGGRKIGLVPTMGALHEGHLSLVRRARELTDIVVVSIFVNPLQFGPHEDFDTYPRDLAADVDRCIAEGVDYVFAPEDNEMYPAGAQTIVEVTDLSVRLEGVRRPGHFRGVATVVSKLFEIVRPTVAAFGQKDAQQVAVVRRMVEDLMFDVEILVLPIVRDADGLALSSRNRRLSAAERRAALAIPRSLEAARGAVAEGQRNAGRVVLAAREVLEAELGLSVDYVELVEPRWLEPIEQITDMALLLVAAYAGETRLIDNAILRLPQGQES